MDVRYAQKNMGKKDIKINIFDTVLQILQEFL